MATQNFINECKNMANANRLGRFELQMYDRFEKEFKGNTFQQTYTGNQLVDFSTFTTSNTTYSFTNDVLTVQSSSGTYNSIRKDITTLIKNNAGKTIRFNCDSVDFSQWDSSNNILVQITVTKDGSTSYPAIGVKNGNNITKSGYVIPNDTSGITSAILRVYTNNSGTANTTSKVVITKPLIYFNDNSSYEPYVGGVQSPNPSYPQSIKNVTGLQNINVCGKNLLDTSKMIKFTPELASRWYWIDGIYATNPSTLSYEVQAGTTYTISIKEKANFTKIQGIYKINGVESQAFIIEGNNTTATFTPNTTTNLYVRGNTTTNNVETYCICQLEKGSTASEYEEYKGNTYEVNLGKNLFDVINLSNIKYVLQSDNSVTISEVWGNAGRLYFKNMELQAGNYTLSYIPSLSGTNKTERFSIVNTTNNTDIVNTSFTITDETRINYSFSLSEDTNIKICIMPNQENAGVMTIKNIQLEKGQATSYSPYFTPIELNDEDSIKKSTGKNLFDSTNANLINAYVDTTITSNANSKTLYIPCKNNTTYTISRILISGRFAVATTNELPNYGVTTYNRIRNDTATSLTITSDNNSKYLVVWYYNANNSGGYTEEQLRNSIMINEGSTALPYEPYGKVWYIEKQIGKVNLEDYEYNKYGASTGYSRNTTTQIPNIKYVSVNTELGKGLCEKYQIHTGTGMSGSGAENHFAIDVSMFQVSIPNNDTPSGLFYYALATPTYEVITNTELINQLESIELLKGTNNISITSEDLPVIFDYSFWNGDTEVDEDDRFLEVNQSNYLTSIELKDSCCVNNNILGTTYTKSAEVELLDLPVGTKLESQIITPEIGVKYNDDTTEYETFDDYVIESLNDEQTASNTKFTAMNGGALLDKEYECSLSFENGQAHTINEFYQDACNQIGLTPTDNIFDNSELIMTGNPFTNKETIRAVISEVEKTSCSVARIDWKNKTISLTWLSDQIDYEFNTSDYSTLEGSLTQYGPLNVIIIANSQLNGENVVMTDQESVAEYGEHQIIIDSPYFLYTEELRTQAIQAIYNKLDGLKYYDLKLTTPYGKPFLNIGDKIRINTNENQVLDTYVLSHTFKFDGTFSSVIESPALTQEEQTIKNEFKGNSVREKLRRTELMVDKTTGDITAITDRVTTVENEFGDVYSKEEVNTLVQNSATGITNTFVNSGGNNLLRNTGLWFEDRTQIEYMYPNSTLYPDDDLFMSADPHWEYWRGNAKKVKEDKAANMSGILLQTGYLEQQQQVRNGTYTLSFKYRKLIELATVNVQINDRYIDLTNIEDTEIIEVGEITSQNISIKIFSDTDDSCIIYDLMLNAGSEKAEYSQHQNETTTDTVNISKGITIQSSDTNTTFKANSDGIRVYNSRDMDTPITEYTDTGMDTNRIKVKEEAEIVKVLWKDVGNNTWISRL